MNHLRVLAALLFVLGTLPPAMATTFPPIGSQGDREYVSKCKKGMYMVGITGKAGSWMDQIQALCAPLLSSGKFGDKVKAKEKGGGNGGSSVEQYCTQSRVITAIHASFTRNNDQVSSVTFYCWLPGRAGDDLKRKMIGRENTYTLITGRQSCTDGEVATGIHGRSGKHVNAIGLICGPLLEVAAPVTTPAPEPSSPAADAFVPDLGSFDGVWDTVSSAAGNYTLILKVKGRNITGNFGHANASLDGTLEGRIAGNGKSFGYTYSQPGIGRTGNGTFQLGSDGKSITGDFFSEQDAQEFHWEGRRRD